ncbi:MAG TPA: head GIN domain-containing protein [Allosphingosinicella sp.]|nr:head GIN domain-containing protein [Allosphingosinicella sp.]
MRSALILISTLALAAACNMADAQHGADEPAEPSSRQSFDVGSFDSVSLGGPYNVIVRVGPAASVRAEGDAEEIGKMEVVVENGDLEIRRRKGERFTLGFRRNRPVTVYVTTPALRAAAIGGSGDMRIDRVEGREFAASIGGSGDMTIDSLRVGEASFSVAGSGAIRAAGTADRSSVSIAGSGDVVVDALKSRMASVSIVGSGDVRMNAAETAEVSIMGSGDVSVTGGAKCSVSKMGSGNVRCG